jgi:hypothetical protein
MGCNKPVKYCEMLGLPGVGKSQMAYNLSHNRSINDFGIHQRLVFLVRGFFTEPMFFIKLLFIRIRNGNSARPVLVLAERLAIYQSYKNDSIIFDEGVLQFIWRSCCELEKTTYLYCLIKNFLQNYEINSLYVKCSKKNNIKNILIRKKRQRYDDSVYNGSFDTFNEGRSTMFFLLSILKDVKYPLNLSVPSFYVR